MPEKVIVQSAAAGRWLGLRLAEFTGICANYEFPFLSQIITSLLADGRHGTPATERPTVELLAWRIDSALRHCSGEPEFAGVIRYLADGDPLKRFALAKRVAVLFDQYRVYRPDLLLRWSGETVGTLQGDEAWQAKLWLAVDGGCAFDQALTERRAHGFRNVDASGLPTRLSIFAPSLMAPAYFDLLLQLAKVSEVHLFLLRPTPEYYADSLTPKQRARLSKEDQPEDVGHPLLASWGKADLEMTDLLLETEERLGVAVDSASEQFQEVDAADLLTTLQRDLFLAMGDDEKPAPAKPAVDAADRSVVLNACHCPMREVEVLYDHLLDCFEKYPALRPQDILVLTPEIEKYGPFIRAVFEYPERDSLKIPYAIVDRHPRSDSTLIDTFLTLLELPGTRFAAPDIFLLLNSRLLRRRFALTEDDLSLIRRWIEETGIRWGIDAAHRAAEHVPAINANTWRQGLDRLLLGFAMEGDGRSLFNGMLPAEGVEGDAAATLGRFIAAAEALFGVASNFVAPRPLAEWAGPLQKFVSDFLEPAEDKEAAALKHLRSVIDNLRTLAGATTPEEVEFKVVRQFLTDQVGTLEQRGSFLGGKVTFCALKPVRSIPAEVVCLLGMNDQVFPRRPQFSEFDLMSERRPGDPSAGADDRFAFLETVLSARRKLLISYVGRSIQDNKKTPPSVVVSELLDHLDQAFTFSEGRTAEEFLLVEHPLHAFSSAYFAPASQEGRLFSYSEANAEASRSIQAGSPIVERPFLSGCLPARLPARREIELGDFIRFWAGPCEYFVRRRLGITLGEEPACLAADEPFDLDALERYQIKQELLFGKLGMRLAGSPAAFAARGMLAPGMVGELQLRSMDVEVERFARIVRNHLPPSTKRQTKEIKLLLDDFTFSGQLHSFYGDRVLNFRCAKLKPKDHLRTWIEHLAFCVNDRGAGETRLVGTDAVTTFKKVENAAAELGSLCELMHEGQTRPLPFFPACAMAYATAEFCSDAEPLRSALQHWHGGWNSPGERENHYVARCFNVEDPLDEKFVAIARTVCGSLVSHSTTTTHS